jgi:hypothetical protein
MVNGTLKELTGGLEAIRGCDCAERGHDKEENMQKQMNGKGGLRS